ncbi:MAG: hypothetical protein ACOCXA_01185 [Planctomycetota bacterium]
MAIPRKKPKRCLGQHAPAASDLIACIDAELERVASGRTGLGERACLVLAILGDAACQEQISRVLNADRFCDRFELQRQRKALDDHGHDHESRELFSADWPACFADDIHHDEPERSDPEALPEAEPDAEAEADTELETDDVMPETSIDWQDFAGSPEAQELPEQIQQVIVQFGPILEQLAGRGLGKSLTDCSDQEFAVLLLQVLPQALPPQYVQIALSPQGLLGLRAVCSYLERTEAGSGARLAAGLDLVRQEIQAQMRASGNLNSSIYDEPDQNPLS